MDKNQIEETFNIVKSGYNRLAEVYPIKRNKFDNWNEIQAFVGFLPKKAKVLDAGSGTGTPVAKYLTDEGFKVVGIDFSDAMIAAARKNVPKASFRNMNLTAIDFPSDSFDGIISCYAIFHVPRENHAEIFKSFHRILKPGGVILVQVACEEFEEIADYLGVEMFWSHYDSAKSESLIAETGFDIKFGRSVKTSDEEHYWMLALKGD